MEKMSPPQRRWLRMAFVVVPLTLITLAVLNFVFHSHTLLVALVLSMVANTVLVVYRLKVRTFPPPSNDLRVNHGDEPRGTP